MRNKTVRGFVVILAGFFAGSVPALANNLSVTNTALMAPADGKVEVRFDISWENSWRDGMNRDAAWVFVKYSIDAGTTWSHATMGGSGTNPPGFTNGLGTSLDIVVPSDKKGAFIQRAAEGTGTISNKDVKLIWDFAAAGISRSRSALVKVFAIEMVYIPEGPFWAGNTNGVINHSFRDRSDPNSPVYIDSTNAFDIYYGTGPTLAPVSNAFPNGYAAFYMMKTEISQRQYCDFLNTLSANQQTNRYHAALYFDTCRNFVKKTGSSPAFFGCDANDNAGPDTAVTNVANLNETDDGEWVACNYISWMDGAAYADWASLRPFTELEFEKACRGPLDSVEGEYAWGDNVMKSPTSDWINQNTASEAQNKGNCNYVDCSPNGPYRCGSYAGASSGRTAAGAGYYGVLDLSGNLWERTVTVGNATGRSFTAEHGDGVLDAEGHANVTAWPGIDANGAGFRGGHWDAQRDHIRMADRISAAAVYTSRHYNSGWRGARSAP